MGQITIRIDDELEKQIEERRGDKPKSDFYREILTRHLTATDDKLITPAVSQNEDHIKSLEQQNSDLRDDKNKLMMLLNQEQALHMRTQKMLPAPGPEKKWYRFWKK
jgi:hypothetical protein